MRYRITAEGPARVKTGHPLLGRIEVSLSAGRTTPRSEVDEVAFEHLVDLGLAERVPETRAEERFEEASEASLGGAPKEPTPDEGGEE